METFYYELLATSPRTAREKLIKDGYKVDILQISPPISKKGNGRKRVIAIKKLESDTLRLIWSYENFN